MSQPGSGHEQALSRAFVGLADTLVDDYYIIDLLDRLVSYSVELLAAVERAPDGSVVRVNGPSQEVFNGEPQGMQFFG